MADVRHYLRFRLGHGWYGIEVGRLVEVLHFVALSDLPASRPDVLGVMRLRESVVPVLDLRLRFGLDATYSLATPIIVARTQSGPVGLVVDDVDDLARIEAAQITPQEGGASPYVAGVAWLDGDLLLLLNLDLIREEMLAPSLA